MPRNTGLLRSSCKISWKLCADPLLVEAIEEYASWFGMDENETAELALSIGVKPVAMIPRPYGLRPRVIEYA